MNIFRKLFGENRTDDNGLAVQDNALTELDRSIRERIDSCKLIYSFTIAEALSLASLIPKHGTKAMPSTQLPLFTPTNMTVLDKLKAAKNGESYGAFINCDGKSVFTKWRKVDPSEFTSSAKAIPIDPATLAVLGILISIEHKLDGIQESCDKILGFLESENSSEVKADFILLNDILHGYKYNFTNERYMGSNHKLVIDILRTSEKNLILYDELIANDVRVFPKIYTDAVYRSLVSKLIKNFENYAAALRAYTMSSLLDLLLLGDPAKDYYLHVANRVEDRDTSFKNNIEKTIGFLEKLSLASIESVVTRGVMTAGKNIGKFADSIPLLNKTAIGGTLTSATDDFTESDADRRDSWLKKLRNIELSNNSSIARCIDTISKIQYDTSLISVQNGIISIYSE